MRDLGLKALARDLTPPLLWRLMSAIKRTVVERPPPPPPPELWQREPRAGESLLGEDDRRFIETRLPDFEGWLGSNAAYFAAYILNVQHASAIAGPILEIGVFAGKFLMLLHYVGRRHGNATVGVDIFVAHEATAVLAHADALFGSTDGLSLHEVNSAELTPESALALLGSERPRAISIDGDHTPSGVLHDLQLSASILGDRGVIILDDVLNPHAAGVVEGTYRFLLDPACAFVPFAQIDNKTFVCRRDCHAFYLNAGRRFSVDCADLEVAKTFTVNRSISPIMVEQDLLGVEVLIFG
jgi:hypothetical protein